MLRFNDIVDRMLEDQPEVDIGLLQRAYVFSAKVHEGQERLSGEPYLVHPLEVAGILVDLHVDDVTVVAGLLHDTLEDTLTTREELERLFGERVAFIVEGLTKIAKIEFSSVRERQAENFRKMLIAMSKDIRILLIKLADRLHNMRTLGHMGEDSARRIAQETLDIYVPLAHRLGIQSMKAELEDLAFRALRPEAAAELEAQIAGKRSERETYIEKPEPCARRDLRRDRLPRDPRWRGRGLLPRARDRPHDLAAGADPLQGLHRQSQAQRISVAAHDRDRPVRRANGGADPYARDAPRRRARDRGALEVQVGQQDRRQQGR
jgi:GTP pyrophosphokinase